MLQADGLECSRGGRTLFRGLDFALQAKDLIRVAGPNGSGKTSLLRILCGLLTPTGGEVRWNGTPITSLREEYSRHVVYLGHALAVKDDLTAAENLAIACRIAGNPADQRSIQKALAQFDLAGKEFPLRKFSQGQRRRAALSRLFLSAEIPVWLLDEPFATLDAEAVRRVEELIAAQVARGGSVAYTTHQEAGVGATRVVELG